MRYNQKVTFRVLSDTYGEDGNYTTTTASETVVYASIDATRQDVMTLVYGGVVQDSLTIQLQNHYDDAFDDIVIDGKAYKVDYRNPKKVKDVFVVSRT